MTRTIKAALILVILSLCALGALFAPKEPARDREPAQQLVPVNNRQPHRIWLRA